MMMSVTSAARRLLRTLWVSQPTVTTDLQRDGRGGPAADGRSWWWWGAAVDRAGTDSSSSTSSSSSSCCVELELWPAANSRPLPPSSFSYSSSFPPSLSSSADRRDNDLRDGDCCSTPSGKANILKNAARVRSDTPSPCQYIIGNSKTILSPSASHIRLLPRSHSVDSISSSASTLISGASYTSANGEGIRKRRAAGTTSAPSIVAWSTKPATRLQRTRSSATQPSADKKGSGDELFWRGYWD